MTMANPTGVVERQPKIAIINWQPRIRNTLRGFFSAILPNGLVLHHLALHEKGETRWVVLPAPTDKGPKLYAKFLDFRDRAAADNFRQSVLAALDEHLESLP
jgi:hypothetical protein